MHPLLFGWADILPTLLEKGFLSSDFIPLLLDMKLLCVNYLLGVEISSFGALLIATIHQ